jgi:hypothetical protein
MPVVLVTAEGAPRAGYTYDDRTGISYEYPSGRYERWIMTGERFLYHRPGVGYTGSGVIGPINPSATAGRWVCDVLDYKPFDVPVSIKRSDGTYFEADTTHWAGPVYWAQGVRPLSEGPFDAVLDQAATKSLPGEGKFPAGNQATSNKGPGGGYASAAVADAVDAYAMQAAMLHVAEQWPGLVVTKMPKNNPGFDIRVGLPADEVQYVEVKGTQASEPLFWMSEGERQFSIREAHRYQLVVIVGIDLKAVSHSNIVVHSGAVGGPQINLQASQWRGKVLP